MNVHGKIIINNTLLETRDAIGVSETDSFEINVEQDSGLLFIEVPMTF